MKLLGCWGVSLWLMVGSLIGWCQSAPLVEIATNYGAIIIELNEPKAPKTVANFLRYVDKGAYDDTIFHRVIEGFMIQGGGFDVDMKKRSADAPIRNEANNGLSNVVGTIAMARTNDPHSATNQFYINVANNTFLNYKSSAQPGYCVFGRVVEGMGVVQKIKKVPVSTKNRYQNVPDAPVMIKRIRRTSVEKLAKEKNIVLTKQPPKLPETTN
jgi:cyclophilin family peptidyl-prolyl cis-trans isomerase